MSDLPHHQPKTQAASNGGPPKPPKKTAKGLGDDSPDERKKLSATEVAELQRWLEKEGGKQK
jgi:hypothetical protein